MWVCGALVGGLGGASAASSAGGEVEFVQEGQEIAEDDPLVEVQTDKTTVEIPSPAGGKGSPILVEGGQVGAVGTVLVVIGEDGAAPAAEEGQARAEPAPQQQAAPDATRIRATPLVRKVAQELGVDLGTLEGTGPQGRITEEDVRRAVTAGDDVRRVVTSEGQPPGRGQEGRRQPLRGVRRLIAEHMARANREVAPVTWVEECDFGAVDLSLLVATTLKAAALSLREFPE